MPTPQMQQEKKHAFAVSEQRRLFNEDTERRLGVKRHTARQNCFTVTRIVIGVATVCMLIYMTYETYALTKIVEARESSRPPMIVQAVVAEGPECVEAGDVLSMSIGSTVKKGIQVKLSMLLTNVPVSDPAAASAAQAVASPEGAVATAACPGVGAPTPEGTTEVTINTIDPATQEGTAKRLHVDWNQVGVNLNPAATGDTGTVVGYAESPTGAGRVVMVAARLTAAAGTVHKALAAIVQTSDGAVSKTVLLRLGDEGAESVEQQVFTLATDAGVVVGYPCDTMCCTRFMPWDGASAPVAVSLPRTAGRYCADDAVEYPGFAVVATGGSVAVLALPTVFGSGRVFALHQTVPLPFPAVETPRLVVVAPTVGAESYTQVTVAGATATMIHVAALTLESTGDGSAAFIWNTLVTVPLPGLQPTDAPRRIHQASYLPLSREILLATQDGYGTFLLTKIDVVSRGTASVPVAISESAGGAGLGAFPAGGRLLRCHFEPKLQAIVVLHQAPSATTATMYAASWEGGNRVFGIAADGACAGEPVGVVLHGRSTSHAGLKAAHPYALGRTGSLVPAAGAGPYAVRVGVAIGDDTLDVTLRSDL